jgi:hypothetical protein
MNVPSTLPSQQLTSPIATEVTPVPTQRADGHVVNATEAKDSVIGGDNDVCLTLIHSHHNCDDIGSE